MDYQRQKIINRLHRLEGQVRGVEGMIRENRNFPLIIQQLEAIRAATNNIISFLIEERFFQNKKTPFTKEDVNYLRRFIKRQ